MSKFRWEPFLWGGVFILLLLSLATPLNLITTNLILVPLVVLYKRLTLRGFYLTFLALLVAALVVGGGLGPAFVVISLFFLPPVVVMGRIYKGNGAARSAVLSVFFVLLAELLLLLLITYASGLEPIDKLRKFLETTANTLPAVAKETLGAKGMDLLVQYTVYMIPLCMILFAAIYAFVTHILARWALRKAGDSIPGLPPIRTWRLPKSIGWYFIITVGLDMFVNPAVDSTILMITLNLLPLLSAVLLVQAYGFLSFISHAKGWGRLLIIAAIVALVVPGIPYVLIFLGLLDVMFPIRDRLLNSRK